MRLLAIFTAFTAACWTAGTRGPSFLPSTPLQPVYTAAVLDCRASTVPAAEGKPISRGGGYGAAALGNMAQIASSVGVGGALDGGNHCLAVERLLGGDDWTAGGALQAALRRFADGQVSAGGPAAATILVPIVSSSDPVCTKDGYYSQSSELLADYGSVTCWERSVRIGLLLFTPDGVLLWKIDRGQEYGSPGGPPSFDPGMEGAAGAIFSAWSKLN
jgi:hypothetical protein